MSQYTDNLTSASFAHTIPLTPSAKASKNNQKQRKARPRFQLRRIALVRKTRSRSAAARILAMGYNGYVGSAAIPYVKDKEVRAIISGLGLYSS